MVTRVAPGTLEMLTLKAVSPGLCVDTAFCFASSKLPESSESRATLSFGWTPALWMRHPKERGNGMLPLRVSRLQGECVHESEERLSADSLAALRESKGLRIQAGTSRHRFIGVRVDRPRLRQIMECEADRLIPSISQGTSWHHPSTRQQHGSARHLHKLASALETLLITLPGEVQHRRCP
jgi:hypothetical protein